MKTVKTTLLMAIVSLMFIACESAIEAPSEIGVEGHILKIARSIPDEDLTLPSNPDANDLYKNVYSKNVHLAYINSGGIKDSSDNFPPFEEVIEYIRLLQPTSISPLVLNQTPDKFDSEIRQFMEITPNLFFAFGKEETNLENPDDWNKMIEYARTSLKYTKCFRLDHFRNISGFKLATAEERLRRESKVNEFFDALIDMGYEHLMLNPWTRTESGEPWRHVESNWISVQNGKDGNDDGVIEPYEPRISKVESGIEKQPGMLTVFMYENPPAHLHFSELPNKEVKEIVTMMANRSTESMQSATPYRWAMPISPNYNPMTVNKMIYWFADIMDEHKWE